MQEEEDEEEEEEENCSDARASDNDEDGVDNCHELKGDQAHTQYNGSLKGAGEGSSSGSEKVPDLSVEIDSRSKLGSSTMRQPSKCSDSDDHIEKESDFEGDRSDISESDKVKLRTPELVDTDTDAGSPATGFSPESKDNSEANAKMPADMDAGSPTTGFSLESKDIPEANVKMPADSLSSEALLNKQEAFGADATSPSGTKIKNLDRCLECPKPLRVKDLQAQDNCICSTKAKPDLTSSFSERLSVEVSGHVGIPEGHSMSANVKELLMDKVGPHACVVCKNPGTLLCCDGKGCKRSFHLSCLDPPLQTIPPGVWLCIPCIKKKIQFGVYSVTEGVESLWDVKEGMQNSKHYFVKYKSLAHVYNRWIPESEILSEAPEVVAKFNRRYQKEKITRWRQEWTEPHRLLMKRQLMPKKLANEFFNGLADKVSYCNAEWLVKWRDLGYEHATWELETSHFLQTAEGLMLIKDYEARHGEAKKASDLSKASKALQFKQNPFHKLQKLPNGCPANLDNDHLNAVNRLREFWHKSHNAVFIDGQERVIKTILFILSLLPHAYRPFLIISTAASISLWENKFERLAPSINVVVYNGSKDVRKMIRTLEFYEQGGCIMFQVLLSHPDAVIEDFHSVESISWEAIIVDECQNSRVSKNLEHLKSLASDIRMLLLSAPLKDNLAEHINLLSFLDPGGKRTCLDSSKFDSSDTVGSLAILKERLARYIAYERKSDSSKFLEYWVPVRLSDVQLELYCATLISNLLPLRSYTKTDSVGALRDILISLRKCCDHPYIVDQSLQSSLTKNHPVGEILDIGVNASGKLLLLDKTLREIQKRKLRVLILFQSVGGAGRNPIGDFLDDFLRQRFGADSYERVDSGLLMSKKQAAMSKFNNKENGRFVFLIENHACLPSIKLSSVDAIIIYDSDWNPLNDLRALQKISIEPQSKQVVVFRLYSSCTVEEKVLILAKQDMLLGTNIQSISPTVSHALLSWGASYLFSKLDALHQNNDLNKFADASTDKLFLDEVVGDLLAKLSNQAEAFSERKSSVLVKAHLSGMSYSRNITLVGEKEGISSMDKDPPKFWSNLLEGRYPSWQYISEQSPRSRRKVQDLDESAKLPAAENEEIKRKRKKVASETIDPKSLQGWLQDKRKEVTDSTDVMSRENSTPSTGSGRQSFSPQWKEVVIPSRRSSKAELTGNQGGLESGSLASWAPTYDDMDAHKSPTVQSEGREKLWNAQRSLHLLLKPELSNLCGILRLPEDVKSKAEVFLGYVMNNHQVSQESKAVLQAFKISLCWRAASLLKHKLDRKESLALAKKYLNYECNEELAKSVYDKLRILKKKFSHQVGALSNQDCTNSLENRQSVSRNENITKESATEVSSDPTACNQGELEDGEFQEKEQVSVHETHGEIHQHIGSLKDELLKKRIDLIDKVYSRRAEEILLKQQREISDFYRHMKKVEMSLNRAHQLDLEITNSSISDPLVRNNKIRLLDEEFSKIMSAFEEHVNSERKKLEALQLATRETERERKNNWIEKAKAHKLDDSFDSISLPDSGFIAEEFRWVDEQAVSSDVLRDSGIYCPSSIPSSEKEVMPEQIPVETGNTASEGNIANRVESAEPTGEFVDAVTTVASGEARHTNTETEISDFQACNINLARRVSDDRSMSLGIEPGVDLEPNRSADNSEVTNLMYSSLRTSGDFTLTARVSSSSGCENDTSTNQEPSSDRCEIETIEGGRAPATSFSPQILVSVQNTSTVLPVHTDPSNNIATSTAACRRIVEPSTVIHDSVQPVQQLPAAAAATLTGQPNNPPTSCSNIAPERTHPEAPSTDRPEMESRPPQLFPMSQLVLSQGINPEPLKNELTRIRLHVETLTKLHEDKKMQLKLESEQEIEKIRKKYETLLQDEDSRFRQQQKVLGGFYDKVLVHQSLAEEFRAKFIDNRRQTAESSQGQNQGSQSLQQLPQVSSQQQLAQRPSSASATASASAALSGPIPPTRPSTSLASNRYRVPPSPISSTTSTPAVRPPSTIPLAPPIPVVHPAPTTSTPPNSLVRAANSVLPTNMVRSQFSSIFSSHGGTGQVRSAPPHLSRFRPASSSAASFPQNTGIVANQQQVSTSLTSSSLHPPAISYSGIFQPAGLGTLQVSHSTSPSANLPLGNNVNIGAVPQTTAAAGPALDNWLMSNMRVSNNQSLMNVGRSEAAADVVCISDEE
ncbi:uncharacterized protein LOC109728999 isoform X3 [Ananas comosus]|nr:uncharacterized protein LOC109728999 isoform X3 [Ananas comosus]